MAKSEVASFWGQLYTLDFYKRSQGRLTRQLTGGAIALVFAIGAYTLAEGPLSTQDRSLRIGVPLLIVAVGGWLAFRLVNYPRFAEFLISVEGEMNKVSWASWPELYRATLVVLTTMLFLGVVLYVYDLLWMQVLTFLGVLQFSPT